MAAAALGGLAVGQWPVAALDNPNQIAKRVHERGDYPDTISIRPPHLGELKSKKNKQALQSHESEESSSWFPNFGGFSSKIIQYALLTLLLCAILLLIAWAVLRMSRSRAPDVESKIVPVSASLPRTSTTPTPQDTGWAIAILHLIYNVLRSRGLDPNRCTPGTTLRELVTFAVQHHQELSPVRELESMIEGERYARRYLTEAMYLHAQTIAQGLMRAPNMRPVTHQPET